MNRAFEMVWVWEFLYVCIRILEVIERDACLSLSRYLHGIGKANTPPEKKKKKLTQQQKHKVPRNKTHRYCPGGGNFDPLAPAPAPALGALPVPFLFTRLFELEDDVAILSSNRTQLRRDRGYSYLGQ